MSERDDLPGGDRIDDDITLMVSGHFTPDAIGPEAYDAVVARSRANVSAYLDAFESRFLGAEFDALAQSDLLLPTMLEVLHDAAPVPVARTAERLLRHYDGALALFDRAPDRSALMRVLGEDTTHLATRLDDQRRALSALLERED